MKITNPNPEDISYWIKEGPQTAISATIKHHVGIIYSRNEMEELNYHKWGKSPSMIAAFKTAFYENRSIPLMRYDQQITDALFRKRDATQILSEGFTGSSSDYAVVFRALMIAQGYRASFLETIDADFVLGKEAHPGRAYVRVFGSCAGDKGIIINPAKCETLDSKLSLLPHIIIGEGLDPWDLGLVLSREDLAVYRKANCEELLNTYEELIEKKRAHDMTALTEFRRRTGLLKTEFSTPMSCD
jgi:hypothetical protein